MAVLWIRVTIDVDPTLEDPQEVADALLSERLSDGGDWTPYHDVTPSAVDAEWATP